MLLLWHPASGGTTPAPTPTPVGEFGKPKRRYVKKWENLARNSRGRFEELPRFYEVVAKAATSKGKSAPTALATVAEEVVETIRPFAVSDALIPSAARIDWAALQASQDALNRLMALYERAIEIELDDQEDLLLIAMLAW